MVHAHTQIIRATGNQSVFLAKMLKLVLDKGLLTNDQFVEQLPPSAILQSVSGKPYLQASVLNATCGIDPDVAAELPLEPAIALFSGYWAARKTNAEKIRASLTFEEWTESADMRIVYLMIVTAIAASSLSDILLTTLNLIDENGLITALDKARQLKTARLIQHLPADIVKNIALTGSELGLSGMHLAPERLFIIVNNEILVEHIPQAILYEVLERMAIRQGFVDAPSGSDTSSDSSQAAPPSTGASTDANGSTGSTGDGETGTSGAGSTDNEQV